MKANRPSAKNMFSIPLILLVDLLHVSPHKMCIGTSKGEKPVSGTTMNVCMESHVNHFPFPLGSCVPKLISVCTEQHGENNCPSEHTKVLRLSQAHM